MCLSPHQTDELLRFNQDLNGEFLDNGEPGSFTFLFDHHKFSSEVFQRPYSYLRLMGSEEGRKLLEAFRYETPCDLSELRGCLGTLLEHCCLQNPTWMELTHFASFLNAQLFASENSIFLNAAVMGEDLPGMKIFVVKFLIQMSKDFATRSVEVSDQSQGEGFSRPDIRDRQRWENSPHPYIFFNEDGDSLSFFGFRLDNQLNLIDERSGVMLEEKIMSRQLFDGLRFQRVVFNRTVDERSSDEKITDLCRVFGVGIDLRNPDTSYELTSDNVMKMLAIYMRFRSNIPVVIMGETGCGKTRLIRFMCDIIKKGKEAERLFRRLEEAESFVKKLVRNPEDRKVLAEADHYRLMIAEVAEGKSLLAGLKDAEKVLQRLDAALAALPPSAANRNSASNLTASSSSHLSSYSSSSSSSSSSFPTSSSSSSASVPQKRPPKKELENLIIMKTHGGVTEEQIYHLVNEAIEQAVHNTRNGIPLTVLFFDEANTTNAIGTIKEVMCDRLVNGVKIPDGIGLQFVAAVNPYRQHSEDMIKKLEKAGLGYHIKADKTIDKLGKIPMRRLVYRVKEIPASMFPLVWDFGTLDYETERKYINQMIATQVALKNLAAHQQAKLLDVLCRSQQFMRERKDECSFVSLRDVERMLTTLQWFQSRAETISKPISKWLYHRGQDAAHIFNVSLILALGVAYYTRLDERRNDYEDLVKKCLRLYGDHFSEAIKRCQNLIIDELKLEKNIAKNDALKENVWMMTICIELKIPLFLVGKPGSSKSLAKTVVTDVMQGETSYSELFKNFKEIHMVSFQCSPLATAGGILSTFRQCQKFQEKRDLNKFTSVCVLDEVGLAEDSEKMPLKALHPLLEDGCVESEKPEPHKKVCSCF